MRTRVHKIGLICGLSLCCLGVSVAVAQSVYKIVDSEGRVTYTDQLPLDGTAGTTTTIKIVPFRRPSQPSVEEPTADASVDPVASVAEPEPKAEPEPEPTPAQARRTGIRQAEAELARAVDDLISGSTFLEGDLVGKSGGGTRPSQQRTERITELEAAVATAQQRLDSLRRQR